MNLRLLGLALASFFLEIYGCSSDAEKSSDMNSTGNKPAAKSVVPAAKPAAEPDYIKVQHILIAFKSAVGFQGHAPGMAAKRTQEEAQKLAENLLDRTKKGEDFGALVKEYTDDSAPGIYPLANTGKPPKPEYTPRKNMVQAFGDTGFPLQVGEIGMAPYDPKKSPFGWHIVKRVE